VVRRLVGGFGCSVLATDVWDQEPPWFGDLGERARYVDLSELLEAVDILTLHMPLTEQTEHMINAKSLSTMRDGALIVNAARGRLIEEAALLEALSTRKLAGAALDVYDEEPLRPTSALRSTGRLILTPHIAWATEEARANTQEMTTTNIRRVLLGEPPLNIRNGVPWRVPRAEGVGSPAAPTAIL
jgi:phosphoglycerate dehydrogenase-like enzyme